MPIETTHHRVKATILGAAFAMPLLAACAYDDGYYGPPADYGYGYGYGYYGYSYGYPCSWHYDCYDWDRRHRHHHRHRGDDDDGDRGRGDRDAGNRPPRSPDDHASNVPLRPRVGIPRDEERGGFARGEGRSSPANPIWIPPARDSRR